LFDLYLDTWILYILLLHNSLSPVRPRIIYIHVFEVHTFDIQGYKNQNEE